jgi:hypothetical protein
VEGKTTFTVPKDPLNIKENWCQGTARTFLYTPDFLLDYFENEIDC